jgi:hypothetical protein
VVGAAGAFVLVAPMSTHPDSDGIYVSGDAVPDISESHVVDFPGKVLRSLATYAEVAGYLPERYLSRVMEQSKPTPS